MHLEKQFTVKQKRDVVVDVVSQDDTLVSLLGEKDTEIVDREGDRRTTRTHYRALGREGDVTFHFTFLLDGDVRFEKVCDGNVWRELVGRVSFEDKGEKTRVKIQMDGRTKSLVPEFTIKGPMQDQMEQMAKALRTRVEAA